MEFTGKRVLITGASGLIGCNLVDKLMTFNNVKVFVTGRNKKKLESTFSEYLGNDNFAVVEHDVADPIPSEINNIDLIFHAAGPMERDVVMNKPLSVVLPNIVGTINLLDFLLKQELVSGIRGRIVVFSSITVYSNPTDKDYVALESNTVHSLALDQPYACYAESKRMAEVIAQAYVRQYKVDAVIARFSTVYGYTKNIPNTAFFEFIKKALVGEDIILNGVGMPRRDNIYVDDAVNGLLILAEKGIPAEAYNISSCGDMENFAAVDEIAECIAEEVSKVTGNKQVQVIKKKFSSRNPGLMLSNEKLKALGWVVRSSHAEGLKRTIINIISK